jgi:hypothetical protein
MRGNPTVLVRDQKRTVDYRRLTCMDNALDNIKIKGLGGGAWPCERDRLGDILALGTKTTSHDGSDLSAKHTW